MLLSTLVVTILKCHIDMVSFLCPHWGQVNNPFFLPPFLKGARGILCSVHPITPHFPKSTIEATKGTGQLSIFPKKLLTCSNFPELSYIYGAIFPVLFQNFLKFLDFGVALFFFGLF